MRYFLDCEFNGYRGELISLALVDEVEKRKLYLIATEFLGREKQPIEWVALHVMPFLLCEGTGGATIAPLAEFGARIAEFLRSDINPAIVADWPDDIRYFCECLITGPGTMVETGPSLSFGIVRVDAYPTTLEGAVQHNALWDARALRHKLLA